QQEVITDDLDVNKYIFPIRHTHLESEITIGSGNSVVVGDKFWGGSHIGYNRMNFRWGNVGTFQISPGSHMWQVMTKYYKDETAESEKADVQGRYHFHPEWAGYMGKAYKAPTFHVTAITMRKRSERPFIYPMGVHMYDCNNIDTTVREAAFFELCERIQPGLIHDVNIPFPMTDWAGAILQVRKRLKT